MSDRERMNVGELIEYLSQFDEWLPVYGMKMIHPHSRDEYDGRVSVGFSNLTKGFLRESSDGIEIGREEFATKPFRDRPEREFVKKIV